MTSPLVTQQLLIHCRASWWSIGLSCGLHLAAILSLILAGLPIHWLLVGSLLLLMSWGINLWSEGLRRTPGAIVHVQLTEFGWQLGLRSGERLLVELLPEVVLLPWLVVLRFRRKSQAKRQFQSGRLFHRRLFQRQTLAVALFPDSVAEPGLRHLRALLRVYSPERPQP
jgi:hypothetical protein